MSKSVQKGTFDRARGRCYLSFMKNKLILLSVLMIGSTAFAMPLRQDIKVGGHFNLAVPLVTYGNDTKTIGEEYTKVGLAPGVTFKLDDSWGFDLEFVAYNNFMNKPDNKGMTSLVVDPGVIYNFGSFTGGLRLAVDVVATQNWGTIPIVVKTIPLGLVSLLLELDLPIFFRSNGTELTIQPQIGVAF